MCVYDFPLSLFLIFQILSSSLFFSVLLVSFLVLCVRLLLMFIVVIILILCVCVCVNVGGPRNIPVTTDPDASKLKGVILRRLLFIDNHVGIT